MVETFFKTLKSELVWRTVSKPGEAREALARYTMVLHPIRRTPRWLHPPPSSASHCHSNDLPEATQVHVDATPTRAPTLVRARAQPSSRSSA